MRVWKFKLKINNVHRCGSCCLSSSWQFQGNAHLARCQIKIVVSCIHSQLLYQWQWTWVLTMITWTSILGLFLIIYFLPFWHLPIKLQSKLHGYWYNAYLCMCGVACACVVFMVVCMCMCTHLCILCKQKNYYIIIILILFHRSWAIKSGLLGAGFDSKFLNFITLIIRVSICEIMNWVWFIKLQYIGVVSEFITCSVKL